LIDTEGQMAIDTFYLTWQGKKLSAETQNKVRRALLEEFKDLQRPAGQ
jgi:UTP:GlnB (protein PII) uridylyltransferase